MWTSQTCFAKRDAVIMVMRHGTACAPSAGGRNTSVYDRNRSRMTLLWQKSKSFCIGADAFTSVFFYYSRTVLQVHVFSCEMRM